LPSLIQATTSRLPSAIESCTSVASPGVGSTRSGARQLPETRREMKACVTPPSLRR
jgi:hypothetical protein